MKRRVGVIGLGAMGAGMARSLLRAGHEVRAFDVRPGPLDDFAAAGGLACRDAAEVAAHSEVLVSVVFDAAQTEALLFDTGGVAAAMAPGSLFVMCSTAHPRWSASMEKRLAERRILYLDAPVSGGAEQAAAGTMTMITAGSAEAYAQAGGVLDAMAANVYRVSSKGGGGSMVKLINQLLVGVHMAAAAEAMALGLREGVDPRSLYEVITHSAGNSRMFEMRMHHVIEGDYTPLAALGILVKDLGLVLDAARAREFPLPLAATAHQMFLHALAAGHGEEASAAVIKIFPGIDLPGT